jgi:hypothetical protein
MSKRIEAGDDTSGGVTTTEVQAQVTNEQDGQSLPVKLHEPSAPATTADAPAPREFHRPGWCLVVRPSFERQRAFCTVDEGTYVREEFRVNGLVPEGADNPLTAFAAVIAIHVAQEASDRDLEVVRLPNSEAGRAVATALREAGFHVIEFAE